MPRSLNASDKSLQILARSAPVSAHHDSTLPTLPTHARDASLLLLVHHTLTASSAASFLQHNNQPAHMHTKSTPTNYALSPFPIPPTWTIQNRFGYTAQPPTQICRSNHSAVLGRLHWYLHFILSLKFVLVWQIDNFENFCFNNWFRQNNSLSKTLQLMTKLRFLLYSTYFVCGSQPHPQQIYFRTNQQK